MCAPTFVPAALARANRRPDRRAQRLTNPYSTASRTWFMMPKLINMPQFSLVENCPPPPPPPLLLPSSRTASCLLPLPPSPLPPSPPPGGDPLKPKHPGGWRAHRSNLAFGRRIMLAIIFDLPGLGPAFSACRARQRTSKSPPEPR